MSEIENKLKHFTSHLTLLYAEDDKDSKAQYETIFKLLFKEVVSVEDGEAALSEYKKRPFDLVITDLTMPRMDGVELMRQIRNINEEQHIIVMTAHNTNENLQETIEFMVDGILIKPVMMDNLIKVLYKTCQTIYQQHMPQNEQNKKTPMEQLIYNLEDGTHALCLAVIDNYSNIIHQFGDRFKPAIINAISEHLSNFGMEDENTLQLSDDAVAFTVDKQYLENILQALQAFSENNRVLKVPVDDVMIYITLSYGVITSHPDYQLMNREEKFLQHINSIVEKIRLDNKSSLMVTMDFNLDDTKESEALKWLQKTVEAVKQNTIVPFFQPIAEIDTLEVCEYEVFARIKEGDKFILPKFFIDLSEKAGILEDISEIIYKKSYEAFQATPYTFHINITDSEWRDNALEHYLAYLNAHYNIDPQRVVLGVTRHDSFKPDGKIMKRLMRLKEMGYKLALKEFGKGAINLEFLAQLRPDYIKIDQLLLQKAMRDEHMKALLSSLLEYTRARNVRTILMYVETEEILNVGSEMGFDCAQGYLIRRPSETI